MGPRKKDLTNKFFVIEGDSCQVGTSMLFLPGCIFVSGDAIQQYAWCRFLNTELQLVKKDNGFSVRRSPDCPFGSEPLVFCTRKIIRNYIDSQRQK